MHSLNPIKIFKLFQNRHYECRKSKGKKIELTGTKRVADFKRHYKYKCLSVSVVEDIRRGLFPESSEANSEPESL